MSTTAHSISAPASVALFLIAGLLPCATLAQGVPQADNNMGGWFVSAAPHHAVTGDGDLDRAVAICDRHAHSTGMIITTSPPQDDIAYDIGGCSAVMDAWGRSEAAKKLREAAQKDADDKAFVAGYAAKLQEGRR